MDTKYCLHCMEPIGEKRICPYCGYAGSEVPPHHLTPGTVLNDDFLVGTAIGQGGFGITYIGRDIKLGLKVAIKEYYPSGYANRNAQVSSHITISGKTEKEFLEDGKKKFLEEARALAQFNYDPGVVNVRRFFEANETAYIIMDYLDGEELSVHLKHAQFSADAVFRLMEPLFETLEHIHEKDIVHRDISPDNIMLLKDGTLKLMDFGAAKIINYEDEKSVSIVLKSGYAPEEQYRSRGYLGPWTDIYALCATIYKCITGITPDSAIDRLISDQMKWPSELGYTITEAQEEILKCGMAVKRESRIQTIRELKETLHALPKNIIDTSEDSTEEDEKPLELKELPVPSKTKPFKKIAAVFGVCIVILLAVGITYILSRQKEPADQNVIVEATIPAEELYNITLTAQDGMSLKGFNDAIEIIKGRLDVFAGEGNYSMAVQDGMIELGIMKTVFGNVGIEQSLKCYISRAMNLYLINTKDRRNNLPIAKEDIKKIELHEGIIDGVDASEYGIETETYEYIEVGLSDDFISKNEQILKEWGENVALAQDVEEHATNYCYHSTFPTDSLGTYYIINNDAGENFVETVIHNLTSDSLECAFLIFFDMNQQVVWEDIQTVDNNLIGANQKNYKDIPDESVTFSYYYDDKLTDGEQLDLEKTLKNRLDIIEQPYAYGIYQEKNRNYIAIKTLREHMGKSVINLVGLGSYFYICTDFHELSVESDSIFEVMGDEQNDEYKLSVTLSDNNKDEFNTMLSLENQDAMLYLRAGYSHEPTQICSTKFDESASDGTIDFTNPMIADMESFHSDNKWFLNLIQSCCTTKLHTSIRFKKYQYNDMDSVDNIYYSNSPMESQNKDIVLTAKRLASKYSDIGIQYSDSMLYLSLHMTPDDKIPENSLNLIKTLYQECDMENNTIDTLGFYIIDEDESAGERCRIFFHKKLGTMVSNYMLGDNYEYHFSDASISVNGVIKNGRMDSYQKDYRNLLEKDSFFYDKYKDNPDAWSWSSKE